MERVDGQGLSKGPGGLVKLPLSGVGGGEVHQGFNGAGRVVRGETQRLHRFPEAAGAQMIALYTRRDFIPD